MTQTHASDCAASNAPAYEPGECDCGLAIMNLVEMFFDWKASTKRHKDGCIIKSIGENKKRFGYGRTLERIFTVTAWSMAKVRKIKKSKRTNVVKDNFI